MEQKVFAIHLKIGEIRNFMQPRLDFILFIAFVIEVEHKLFNSL